jgi:hypothetical protein
MYVHPALELPRSLFYRLRRKTHSMAVIRISTVQSKTEVELVDTPYIY